MPEAVRTTIPDTPTTSQLKRGRLLRRLFFLLLAAFLALGVAGRLGVRTASTSGSAEGYTVTVTYASMTRPGLASNFGIQIERVGGIKDSLTLAVSTDYLDMFDENGLEPDPAVSRAGPDFVYWTFDTPPDDILEVSFDARIEPGVQWGRRGVVKLIRESDTVLEVGFKTWVMP